jgi:hypothetical protein
MGLSFAISYRKLGQWTSDFYFRLLNIRYSVRSYQLGFLIAGICFIAFGLLSLSGVIHTR